MIFPPLCHTSSNRPTCVSSLLWGALSLFALLITAGCPATKHDPSSVVQSFHDAAQKKNDEEASAFVLKPQGYSSPNRPAPLPPRGTPRLFWEQESQPGVLVIESAGETAFLSKGVFEYTNRETPENTLNSFAIALRHQRADLLVAFVPDAQGPIDVANMEKYIQQSLFQSLLNNWSEVGAYPVSTTPLERTEHLAVIQSGTHVFWLVSEPSGWKVQDIQEK